MPEPILNPEDRIDHAVAQLRKLYPSADPRRVAAAMSVGAKRSTVRRLRWTLGVSLASALLVVAAILAPRRAMASLVTILKTERVQKLYYMKTHSLLHVDGTVLIVDSEDWHFPDRTVTNTFQRVGVPENQVDDLTDFPPRQNILWLSSDGTTMMYEPQFHYALRYRFATKMQFHDESEQYASPESAAIGDLVDGGKLVRQVPNVKAHGDVFDEYDIRDDYLPVTSRLYVDRTTNLVRFIDLPRYVQQVPVRPDSSETKPQECEKSIELRYPTEEELAQSEPKVPVGVPVMSPNELRGRFDKEIDQPVATQTVGGVSCTLYGVIVRGPGQVWAITGGGATQDRDEPYAVEILNAPTRPYSHRTPSLGGNRYMMPDPYHKIRYRSIWQYVPFNGKDRVIQGSMDVINGQVPATMTIKVPVWKHDLRYPYKPDHPREPGNDKVVYPSMFVGYATFTTSKIYEMPGGIVDGVSNMPYPSAYPTTSDEARANIPVAIGK